VEVTSLRVQLCLRDGRDAIDCCGAGRHVQGVEGVFEVFADGGFRDIERVCDLAIGLAAGDAVNDLSFTPGHAGRVVRRRHEKEQAGVVVDDSSAGAVSDREGLVDMLVGAVLTYVAAAAIVLAAATAAAAGERGWAWSRRLSFDELGPFHREGRPVRPLT
jgi:hypothetical protein